ncbi:uncharacterized protein LOC127721531 [Mytilus californianus]|uniref:uncharacterized protein LOC127721531 n=1 Tax=Mytilus californianus TaxID=6549 RepID=UPI00224600F9|nr:uncharacterized protein LOC127721531 [Mytilus californianus]
MVVKILRDEMRRIILATFSCCLFAAVPKFSDLDTWKENSLLAGTFVICSCILLYYIEKSSIRTEWNSYKSKRFLQVMKLSIDTSTEVVRILANQNLLQNYGGCLTTFLQAKTHYFFHQWEPGKFTCVCSPAGCNIKGSKSMSNWLFKKIYSQNSNPVGGHFIVRNKKVEQQCIHAFTVNPGLSIDTVDITVLVFILRHCGALTVQQLQSLEEIAFVRNQMCHAFSTKQYTEMELDQMWTTLEQAILSVVPQSFRGIIKEQISLLTRVDFECEEIERMGRKINEIKTILQAIDDGVNRNGIYSESIKELDTNIQSTREDIRELRNTVEKNVSDTMDFLQCFEDRENRLAMYFGKLEKKIENLETTVRTYACCKAIEDGTKEINDSKGKNNGKIDLYIKIPSGQIDEATAIEELRKIVQKQNEAFKITSVEKNCVLIELEIPRDRFTDEVLLETSFSSIIQSIVQAGHVDTGLSASMEFHFVIQTTITSDELKVLKNMSSFTTFSPINDEQSAESDESSCTDDEDVRRVISEEENVFQTKKWSKLDDIGGYRVTVETAVQVDLLSVPYVNKITKDNKNLREELQKKKEANKDLKKELKRFQGKRHTRKRRKFTHDSRSRQCSRGSSSVPRELEHVKPETSYMHDVMKRCNSEPVHLQELMTTSESESFFMHVSSELATSESDVSKVL